jgi:tetratricopeptide (TPR) repeat protein
MLNVTLTTPLRNRPMNAARAADPYAEGIRLSAASRHGEAIACFEKALAAAPDDTRVLFALGNTARALGMGGAAEEFFRRVLALEPARLEAIVNLANLLRANGQSDAAEAILAPALARAPHAAELWLTMGSLHRERGDAASAEHHYREALARNGSYAPALGNLADLLANRGETAEAFALYDRAIKLDSSNAQLRLNRAILHLLCGNLKDGWRDYAARLNVPGKAPICDHGLPRWTGDALKRKRLLVTAEQGVGDQIMFASLIPALAASEINLIMDCEPRLVSLLARSFANVTVKPQQMETKGGVTCAHYGWLKAAGGANAAVELGSLPRILRREISDFPNPHRYLIADEQEKTRWRETFSNAGEGPFTGICWRSGKTGGLRGLQYAPLEQWAAFIAHLPGTIVCVQYDAAQDEIDALQTQSGRKIFVPQGIDQKQELDRACALMSALDCAVSAPTAVSWLAAGSGTPTYKMLYDSSWTSFGADHEPFAPAAMCVKPAQAGDWRDGFSQTENLIKARFAPA